MFWIGEQAGSPEMWIMSGWALGLQIMLAEFSTLSSWTGRPVNWVVNGSGGDVPKRVVAAG
jgi:hypothetical protein